MVETALEKAVSEELRVGAHVLEEVATEMKSTSEL